MPRDVIRRSEPSAPMSQVPLRVPYNSERPSGAQVGPYVNQSHSESCVGAEPSGPMKPIALLSNPQPNFALNAMAPLRPGNEPSAGEAVSSIRATPAATTRRPPAVLGACRDGCIAPLRFSGDRLSHYGVTAYNPSAGRGAARICSRSRDRITGSAAWQQTEQRGRRPPQLPQAIAALGGDAAGKVRRPAADPRGWLAAVMAVAAIRAAPRSVRRDASVTR